MKLARLSVAEAEGTVLAHTHRLAGGALKKGRRLSARDLEALAADGHRTVVVAVLGAADVSEDEAALGLAEAVAGSGVRVAPASTGRSNLFAARRGLFVTLPARVDAVNLVDSALTLATIEPFTAVEAETMVATVKVIPFAVSRDRLEDARGVARGAEPLLSVRRFVPLKAGLVLTRLPGVRDRQLVRAEESQRTRLRRLGGELTSVVQCDHHEAAVAEAIRGVLGTGPDLVLALGASAICDCEDVIPAGLVQAGGVVEHFGMPVDPGNLLLLGRKGPVPIIGVPGCARSLKRSGFDTVLERIAAGVPVGRREIMRLGAGGLLKEIPSRPQPRGHTGGPGTAGGAVRVAAVVLAAGASRRMGAQNKLLSEVRGRPMVEHVVDALVASRAEPIVVVTGHDRANVEAALRARAVQFAYNPDFARGMATSLVRGIDALREIGRVDAALIVLGDMPLLRAHHIDRLIDAFDPSEAYSVCVPVFDRKRGHPVLWAESHFEEMRQLGGDVGARALLRHHAHLVKEVPMPDAAINVDVDTPGALLALVE